MSNGVVEKDEIRNGMSPLPVDHSSGNAEQSRTAAHVALAASCATNSSGDRSGHARDHSADAAQSRVSPHLMETAHSCKLRFGQWVPHSIPDAATRFKPVSLWSGGRRPSSKDGHLRDSIRILGSLGENDKTIGRRQ